MSLSDKKAVEVLQEIARRKGLKNPLAEKEHEKKIRTLKRMLFPRQLEVLEHPSKKKAGHPGRRAGKTFMCAVYLLVTALENPMSTCLYIALTRKIAKKLMWSELRRINFFKNLGIHFNNSELIATMSNGSMIMLGGCDDASDVDKYRGDKYALVVVDEAASFGYYFEELLEEAIEPALMDLDGTLMLVGTPANHCTGPFFEACNDTTDTWHVFHWTMLDNPKIPHAPRWLKNKKREKQWADDNPIYLREYMGAWVRSLESVVYGFSREKNLFSVLPDGFEWMKILGVDLGADHTNPKTAFTVQYCSPKHKKVYTRQSFKNTKMTSTEIHKEILSLVGRHDAFDRIVMDTGALGKAIAEEITRRFDMKIFAAEKTKKYDFIEQMDDDLRHGRVLLHEEDTKQLQLEYVQLQYDEDRRREDRRYANHCADSALYSWRESLHWIHRGDEDAPPEYGSQAYWEKEALEMEERECEQMARENYLEMQADEEEYGQFQQDDGYDFIGDSDA